MALFIACLVTGAYAVYTRSDLFNRRTVHAEIARLVRSEGPNFHKQPS
jgi:hypothetical protein